MLEAHPLQLTLESDDGHASLLVLPIAYVGPGRAGQRRRLDSGRGESRELRPLRSLTQEQPRAVQCLALQGPFGVDSEQEEASARVAPG
jgi:hypothetical protein